MAFGGGDTNLYAYVNGNPVSARDPQGLRAIQIGITGTVGDSKTPGVTVIPFSMVIDDKGNVGIAVSAGPGGVMGSTLNASVPLTIYPAEDTNIVKHKDGLTDLDGVSNSGGIGLALDGVLAGPTVGFDLVNLNLNGNSRDLGLSLSLGFGAGTPIQAHGFRTSTKVIPLFNIVANIKEILGLGKCKNTKR